MPSTKPIPASAIAAEIDELGALEKRVLPFKPDLARIEVLRKSVRAHFEGSPASATFEPRGDKFFAVVGPRGNERVINYQKLLKQIGGKVFASIATVTLKALDGLSPSVAAAVTTTVASGPRTIKTFENPQK